MKLLSPIERTRVGLTFNFKYKLVETIRMGAGETLAVCVTNCIPVAEGHEEEFEDRFSKRVHLVDKAPGFLRNEVHRPRPMKFSHKSMKWENDSETQGFYYVKTWWRSMEDFENWTRSKEFAIAHSNKAPKEMFAGASHLEMHEVFLSTDLIQKKLPLSELALYNGENGRKIYIALCGKVFDVTESAGFYGPGGAYHVFAGRDASRGLAKGILDPEKLNEGDQHLSDLSIAEEVKLEEWLARFESKYPCIALLGENEGRVESSKAPTKQPRAYKKTVILDKSKL